VGRLGHDFASCEVGSVQSPIDIDQVTASTPSTLSFNYAAVPLVVANNGHTIQVNYPEGSTVSIDGDDYELLQFHFHTPSEHRMKGRAAAMELHLVHRNAAGELAVVGVMLEPGKAHPAIDAVWKNIPEEGSITQVERISVNAGDLLPESTAYFSYVGSLTTPPCSEGVRWNILQEPVQVSEAQIAAFENLYQVNARPIQPTNGRIIQLHEAK
jgi:carbonic anhydrase